MARSFQVVPFDLPTYTPIGQDQTTQPSSGPASIPQPFPEWSDGPHLRAGLRGGSWARRHDWREDICHQRGQNYIAQLGQERSEIGRRTLVKGCPLTICKVYHAALYLFIDLWISIHDLSSFRIATHLLDLDDYLTQPITASLLASKQVDKGLRDLVQPVVLDLGELDFPAGKSLGHRRVEFATVLGLEISDDETVDAVKM